MKNQKKFRVLTFIGVFALLSISLSSCFYGGYRSGPYYGRPAYGYRYARPQVRVYTPPPRYYSYHDNYRKGNNYRRGNGNYRGNSRGRR